MLWFYILAAVLVVALLPWIVEALRRPVRQAVQAKAPGFIADLPQGGTHYQWFGADAPRILVLVHGLSSPSWVFSGLTRSLTMAGYRVLSYDLYGRGFSDRVAGQQSLAFHSAQLKALLDALEIDEPVALLGYSMGGAIAATFAAAEPDRVDRLVLLAPAGVIYNPGRLLSAARGGGPFGDWLWGLLGGPALRYSAWRDSRKPTVIPDLQKRIGRELRHRGYLGAILSSERHSLDESLKPVHREIAAMYIPTLAIWGEEDGVIPVSSVGQFSRWNRKAHQEVIAGAGHGLAYTHPKQVLAAIRDFLREVPD